jgi:hypothetical protein
MSKLVITIELPDGATVAVSTDESAAPAKPAKGKAKAAPESAPAATPAQDATAPAPQPAQSPVPTISKEKLNKAVTNLAGVDRDGAIAILNKFGVRSTATLAVEKYQEVFDAFEEAQAKFDAAAAQVSLV